MTCSPLLLARYLDNRLSGDELLDCLNHAHNCQTCRQALMEVRRYEARELYKQPKLVPVPTGFAAGLLQKLQQVRLEPSEPGEWLIEETDGELDDIQPPRRTNHAGRHPMCDWEGLIVDVLRRGPVKERPLAKAIHGCLCTTRRTLAELERRGVLVKTKGTRQGRGKAPNVWSLAGSSQVCMTDISPEKVADAAEVTRETEGSMSEDKELELRVVGKLGERARALMGELEAFAGRVEEYKRDLEGLKEVREKLVRTGRPRGCKWHAEVCEALRSGAGRVAEVWACLREKGHLDLSLGALDQAMRWMANRGQLVRRETKPRCIVYSLPQEASPKAVPSAGRTATIPAAIALLAEAGELSTVDIAARLGKHRIRVAKSLRKAERKGLVSSRQLAGQKGRPIVWSLSAQAKTA